MSTFTIIFPLGYLREWNVITDLDVCTNEELTSAIIFLKKKRFTYDFITLNRISRTNYHINYGNLHIRTKTALQCAKELKKLILQKKFNLLEG